MRPLLLALFVPVYGRTRSLQRISIAVLCTLAFLLAAEPVALAQAGSTGGTIGKTDKTLSGGEERRPSNRKGGERKASAVAATISGRWSWQAKCENGSLWTGEFDFDQNADGTLSGSCRCISGAGSCSTVSGQLAGNKVTLTVRWLDILGGHQNPYEFTIAAGGQSMQGIEHSQSGGICTYQVKRLSRGLGEGPSSR